MSFVREEIKTTDTGFKQTKRTYLAQDCKGCPVREKCHKQKGNKSIEVNTNLNRHKSIIRKRLNSKRGKIYRSRRPFDVEAVNRIIKGNRNFRKFLLRGMEKVEIEAGLLALAHNLSKLATKN